MTGLKKITALLVTLALVLLALAALASCGGDTDLTPCTSHVDNNNDGRCDNEGCGETVTPSAGGKLTYSVTIRDYFGNLPEGSFVLEVDVGAADTVKARIKDGAASLTLDSGSYEFVINTDGKYVYDTELAKWTPESREAEIVLYSPTAAGQNIQVVCTSHTDSAEDNDCRCDLCGLTLVASHANEPAEDCKCDVCEEVITSFHKDEGLDCMCDVCVQPYHPDLDKNLKCDGCGAPLMNLEGILEGRRPVPSTNVAMGASIVSVDAGEMTYFIFTPAMGGIYKFSCIAEGESSIGYYGAPHFVQKENTATVVNGAFKLTILSGAINEGDGGTSQYVIGIKTETADSVILLIEREDDAPTETPFVDIRAEVGATKYDDPLNNGIVDIDVTKAVNVVYNENDGYYHYGTADGPLVLVKITASGNTNIKDFSFASFKAITESNRLCCYFYDGDTVTRKESYNVMIEDYAALAGSRGLVPLDKTLADALKNMGAHNGWWERGGVGYIFGDVAVNAESAWLFACSYVVEDMYGSASLPISVTPEAGKTFAVALDANSPISVKLGGTAGSECVVTVTNATGDLSVLVGSDMYSDEDGDGTLTFTVAVGTTLQVVCGTDTTLAFTCEVKKLN